jgi:hypothetical protein
METGSNSGNVRGEIWKKKKSIDLLHRLKYTVDHVN